MYGTLWQVFRELSVSVLLEIMFCCFTYGTVCHVYYYNRLSVLLLK